jgi:hypothetical protein
MLGVYRRYGGDIDGWVRIGTPAEQAIMADEDFFNIGSLVQKLALVKSGLAAEEYASRIRRELQDATADDDVARQIQDLAQCV